MAGEIWEGDGDPCRAYWLLRAIVRSRGKSPPRESNDTVETVAEVSHENTDPESCRTLPHRHDEC